MLSVTPIYASLLGLLIIYLGYRVTVYRRSEVVPLGEVKGSKQMLRAVRVHGNAVENVPLGLLLLLMLELNHLTPWLLHVLGASLLLSRVFHAYGLSRQTGLSKGRFYGTILTWLSIVVMAILNIVILVTR